ncbi:MAG: hypothetical protein J5760_00080, partial [Clostridia bacterium]|nr:hypothetical protein [Clostridia bacterium]
MNENTLYNAFANISDSLTDAAYEANKPARAKKGKYAAIAAALVVAAAAIVGALALRGRFDKNVVEKDENILYRSENGDFTVRVVEPLDVPKSQELIWAPTTVQQLKDQAEVFIGTIEKVDEVEVSYVYDGVPCTNYYSLLTVRANDIIKGSG